ncbi:GntR family transcriptional regulator [Paralcaligenes ginsengisoli]
MQNENASAHLMTKSVNTAYEYITREIEAGRLAPGEFIREESIADTVKVSRTPVREALRILAAEGWLEIKKNQGVRVNDWNLKNIEEIFDARVLIEPYLARLCVNNMSPDDIEQLVQLAEEMSLNQGNTPEAISQRQVSNDRFHKLITERSNNQVLCTSLNTIKKIPLIKWTFKGYSEHERIRSNTEHFEMIDAIRTKNAELMESIMKSHILHGKNSFLLNLKK